MKKLLKRREFLEQYSISNTKFYELLKAGELSIVKVGRATFIPTEVADAWLNKLRGSTDAGGAL